MNEASQTRQSKTMAEVEKDAILTAYEANGKNAMKTATELGISIFTLYRRLRRYRGAGK